MDHPAQPQESLRFSSTPPATTSAAAGPAFVALPSPAMGAEPWGRSVDARSLGQTLSRSHQVFIAPARPHGSASMADHPFTKETAYAVTPTCSQRIRRPLMRNVDAIVDIQRR